MSEHLERYREMRDFSVTPELIKRAELPQFIAPQLATLVTEAPRGGAWVYEVKHDGYLRDSWLDGEIVVPGPEGRSSFQGLQNAFDKGSDAGTAKIAKARRPNKIFVAPGEAEEGSVGRLRRNATGHHREDAEGAQGMRRLITTRNTNSAPGAATAGRRGDAAAPGRTELAMHALCRASRAQWPVSPRADGLDTPDASFWDDIEPASVRDARPEPRRHLLTT